MIADVNRRFAERVRLVRIARGLSARALAERASLPEYVVYKLEARLRGKSPRIATIGEAAALAAALDVGLDRLVGNDDLTVQLTPGGAR